VVAGGHDQPSGALGAGVVAEGSAMYASGTVECICPAFSALILSPELCAGNLCTYDFALPGMYTTVAFSLTGGNLLKWFRDEWCPEERATAVRTGRNVYDLILEGLSPEPSDVLVLPYFTPSGTPYFDTRTPGAVLGLRLSTRRGEVLRGLMEGVALEMRLNLDILERSGIGVRDLRAIGGGARSRTLTQLKADVINRPISTVAVTEAGCFGMAMWACAALAHADVREVAGQWVRVTSVLTPNPRTADLYQARFEAYQRAYAALKALAAEPLRAPRT
jgi:xylulokinase